jgi:hypothetical protein
MVRSPRASCRRNRRTSTRRRRGSAAWSAPAVPRRRGSVRSNGFRRSRRDGAMLLLQQLQRTPLAGADRCGPRPARLRPTILGRHGAAGRAGSPVRASGSGQRRPARRARRMHSLAAVALTPAWRQSCIWICRWRTASARRESCAWIISVQALPPERKPCRFADPPTAPTPVHRLVAIVVVAINRNAWSQSIGIAGRDRPVRAACLRAYHVPNPRPRRIVRRRARKCNPRPNTQ